MSIIPGSAVLQELIETKVKTSEGSVYFPPSVQDPNLLDDLLLSK